jgi:hypothetical protein
MRHQVIIFLLFTSSALSQVNLLVHTGLDIPSADASKANQTMFLAEYWSSGIKSSLGAEYALSPNIWIATSLQYVHFEWDHYNYRGPMIPEIRIVSAHGDNSEIYRATLEARFIASYKFIVCYTQLYFTTGLAYAIENIGKIRVMFNDMNGQSFTREISYPNRSYLNHTLGIGTCTNIAGPFCLDISAKYFTDYDRSLYTSYNVGIVYSFTQ